MCSLQAHYHQWRGHSCPVTRMLFLASDTHLLTTGSRDYCILQWAVEGKLPVLNEEEDSDMDNEIARASRRQIKDNHKLSDNESYHSDYSPDEQEDDDHEYSKNVARGKQGRGRQQPSENSRYSDAADSMQRQAPQGRGRPSRKSHHLDPEGEYTRAVGRSPRRNIPAQDTRTQQGSYAERFNKHKAASNARWNPQSASDPQQEPEDMGHYSDESPRQRQGHAGRGGGRSRHPARGQDKELTRRPMR